MLSTAYVTLLLNTAYLPGTLALCKSLDESDSEVPIVLLYSKSGVSAEATELLKNSGYFAEMLDVDNDIISSRNHYELTQLLKRSELDKTLTKLNCWRLIKYDLVAYLDSDMLIVRNIDDLFKRDVKTTEIVASPDAGWPDCFNSGLFLLKPSLETFRQLKYFAETTDSFDGSDQGLLNEFFHLTGPSQYSWTPLPFTYNCTISSNYEYVPALARFQSELKVVHFIGSKKPWQNRFSDPNAYRMDLDNSGKLLSFTEMWWDVFDVVSVDGKGALDLLTLSGNLQPAASPISAEVAAAAEAATAADAKPKPVDFPAFYYKASGEAEISNDSAQGEAWKMNESKVVWPQGEPEDYPQADTDPTSIYVRSHPIFPWESTSGSSMTTSRVFDKSPAYEPPQYTIKIHKGKKSVKPKTSTAITGTEGQEMLGFDDGEELERYISHVKQLESTEDDVLNENPDELSADRDGDEAIIDAAIAAAKSTGAAGSQTEPAGTTDDGKIIGADAEDDCTECIAKNADAARVEDDIEAEDIEDALLEREPKDSFTDAAVDNLSTEITDKVKLTK